LAAWDLDDAFFFAVVRFAVVFLVVFFVVAIFKKENNIVFDYGMTKNIGNENKRNMSHPSQKIISKILILKGTIGHEKQLGDSIRFW
jgi:hypothetical protein